MTKLVLVQPYFKSVWESLACGYIGAYVKKHYAISIEADFYQSYFDPDPVIIEGCRDADYVGFSCTSPVFKHGLELARKIREVNPDCVTVFGGVHSSAVPEQVVKHSEVDKVVVGEGEKAMLEIMLGKWLGKLVHCFPIENLDAIPFPDRSLIKNERTISLTEKNDGKRICSVLSSRGCPNNCLHGDTLIDTTEGVLPIKELVGKTPKVLTRNSITLTPEYAQASEVRMTRKNADLLRIYFDKGMFIDCTPDHLFLTFKNGNQYANVLERQVQAKDLEIGQRLRAIHYYKLPSGYVCISWGRRNRTTKHKLILEAVLGRKLAEEECVHHLNGNKEDNIEANVTLTNKHDHLRKLHPEISERMKKNNPAKDLPRDYFVRLGKMQKGKVRSLESRLRYRLSKLGDRNPNYKHGQQHRKSRIKEVNHKVTKIEKLSYKANTYCMEVPGYNWFYANEVLVHNCVFCSDHAVWSRSVRHRTVDNVLDEIEMLVDKYNIDLLKFADAELNSDRVWLEEFCVRKAERGIDVPWGANIHVGNIIPDTLVLMRAADCEEVWCGVESGSPRILKEMRKGITVEQVKKVFAWAEKIGLRRRAYFMVGFPSETYEDFKMTMKLAEDINADTNGMTILCPYPGSDLYDSTRFADVDWSLQDEYSNSIWSTAHFSNEDPRRLQAEFMDKFADRLTWRHRVDKERGR